MLPTPEELIKKHKDFLEYLHRVGANTRQAEALKQSSVSASDSLTSGKKVTLRVTECYKVEIGGIEFHTTHEELKRLRDGLTLLLNRKGSG